MIPHLGLTHKRPNEDFAFFPSGGQNTFSRIMKWKGPEFLNYCISKDIPFT